MTAINEQGHKDREGSVVAEGVGANLYRFRDTAPSVDNITYHESVAGSIHPAIRREMDRVRGIAAGLAANMGIKVLLTEVLRFESPDDQLDQIVFRQTVDGTTEIAMEYWDSLGEAVQEAAVPLSPAERDLLINGITTDILRTRG